MSENRSDRVGSRSKTVYRGGPIKFFLGLSEILGAPGGGASFYSRLGFHFAFSLYHSVFMKLLGAS